MSEHKQLASWVYVRRDEQGGNGEWFGPDDDLPQWAIDQLTDNPRCWQTDTDESSEGPPAGTLMGGVYEPGSMVSTPETRVGSPPSSAPRAHPATRRSPSPAGADKGLAEAERRFGPPSPDAA